MTTKLFTVGVYDMLHIGHILLFKHAKELLENCTLTVAVQDSETILKYKPDTKIINNTEERVFMVSSIRYVDNVVIYKDVDIDIQKYDFDIFVKGPDQCHEGFQRAIKWCQEHNRKVVTIPRTEGISSSILRSYMKL